MPPGDETTEPEADATAGEEGPDPVEPLLADKPRREVPADLPGLRAAPRSITRSGDLLAFYLAEVRRYPLLDPEEERKYAVAFQEHGDRQAAERLVTANLRLVIK